MRILTLTVALSLVIAALGCGANSRTAEPPEQPGAPAEAGGEAGSMAADMASATNLPKLWDFSAVWCGPCQDQAPIVHELEEEYAGIIEVSTIDVDQNGELAGEYGIRGVPTLVFLDDTGKELTRHVGLWPKDSIVAQFKTLGFID